MARGAVAHGVSEICFTDHFDILDIDGSYNPNYDWAPAREQQQLALAACGDKVKIHYGIEIGNGPPTLRPPSGCSRSRDWIR